MTLHEWTDALFVELRVRGVYAFPYDPWLREHHARGTLPEIAAIFFANGVESMSVEHTPGPWEAIVVSGDVRHYLVPGDRQKLNTNASWAVGPKSRSRLHAQADARLIAAAPDLLIALRSLVEAWGELESGGALDCLGHAPSETKAFIDGAISGAREVVARFGPGGGA